MCSSSIALALSQVCSYVHVGQYFVAAEFLGPTTNKSRYVHGVSKAGVYPMQCFTGQIAAFASGKKKTRSSCEPGRPSDGSDW